MAGLLSLKDFTQEKAFSYGIAILIILAFAPEGVADSYLILGHAHFMMTALYQYKMGRITPRKLVIYLLTFALMFKVAHMFPGQYTVFASGFLLVHVFSGEIRHLRRNYSLPYFIMTVALITVLCTWMSMRIWDFEVNMIQIIAVLNVFVAYAGFVYLKTARALGGYEPFFPTLALLYLAYISIEYSGHRPSGFETFGFIVIAHYMTTYFNVTKSFWKKSPDKAKTFIKESFAMNGLFLAGYLLVFYVIGQDNALYTYAYDRISFYVWTVMHFITTWNWAEYRDVFKMPAPLAPAKATQTVASSAN